MNIVDINFQTLHFMKSKFVPAKLDYKHPLSVRPSPNLVTKIPPK